MFNVIVNIIREKRSLFSQGSMKFFSTLRINDNVYVSYKIEYLYASETLYKDDIRIALTI